MNKVNINAKDTVLPLYSGKAAKFAVKVLRELGRDNWELSILFCKNKTIKALNKKYRNKDEATDILSFNLGIVKEGKKNTYLPGDIVISLQTLKENAKYFNIPEDEELRRLIIHGILHLDGMEHKTNKKTEPMLVLQEKILEKFKDEHIIPIKKGGNYK